MLRFLVYLTFFLTSFLTSSTLLATTDCGNALPADSPNFCSSFKKVASCYCLKNGGFPFVCNSMKSIYRTMVFIYGSQERACTKQTDTSFTLCMDAWNCYREGGKDSQGKLCSGTGKSCEDI